MEDEVIAEGVDGGDGSEFAVGEVEAGAKGFLEGFFLFAVAHAAEVEVRAIADVALVLIGPADEAVVAIFWFHEWKKCPVRSDLRQV